PGDITISILDALPNFPDSLRSIYQPLLNHAAAVECKILSGQLSAARDLLTRFDVAYRRLKREAGGLTFDDVARRLAEEFSQYQRSEEHTSELQSLDLL